MRILGEALEDHRGSAHPYLCLASRNSLAWISVLSVVEGLRIPIPPLQASWQRPWFLSLLPPHQPVPADGEAASLRRASQPVRVPMVAVSSSRPCFSSWAVSRANLAWRGWPGGRNVSLRWRTGGLALVRVVVAVELAGPERELDAAEQGRVRVGLEVGIDQVRDLPRMPVQLDQVRPLDLAQVRPGAALVHPEQRLERIERVAVDIEGIRQELPDRRTAGTPRPPPRHSRPGKQVIGQAAGLGVAAEEGPDVALEADRQAPTWADVSEIGPMPAGPPGPDQGAGDFVSLRSSVDPLEKKKGFVRPQRSNAQAMLETLGARRLRRALVRHPCGRFERTPRCHC